MHGIFKGNDAGDEDSFDACVPEKIRYDFAADSASGSAFLFLYAGCEFLRSLNRTRVYEKADGNAEARRRQHNRRIHGRYDHGKQKPDAGG